MAIAVLSHWFFDLMVHTPDLPIWSDASIKLGFGLWNNAVATYVIESAFLAAGLWVYFRSTTGTSFIGRYGMGFFVVILLLINAINIFGPPFGDTKVSLAIPALAMYFLFAGAAHWLDGKRS